MPFFNKTKPKTTITSTTQFYERENKYWVSAVTSDLEDSALIRACINPLAKAVGKASVFYKDDEDISDEKQWLKWLLIEPNFYQTMQQLLESAIYKLKLTGNAFILINRNEYGIPSELVNLNIDSFQLDYTSRVITYTKQGKTYTSPYADIIHLRQGITKNGILGSQATDTIRIIVQTLQLADLGLQQNIKNSNNIKGLLTFNSNMGEDDLKSKVQNFTDQFYSSTSSTAVAGVDTSFEFKQLTTQPIMVSDLYVQYLFSNLCSIFGTNQKIIQHTANEDEHQEYYDAEISPLLKQLTDEFTRKLFTRTDRLQGDSVIFGAGDEIFMSTKTKLELHKLIDRAVLTINEYRKMMGKKPMPGGDVLLLRKDTGTLEEAKIAAQGGV